MVQKLQRDGYLKRYDNMTAAERKAYEERVGEWMRSGVKVLMTKAQEFNARMQNIETVSLTWNDAECQAFEEGTMLLSALMNLTDTWLPDMLYVKSAKRAIVTMYEAINAVIASGHNDTAGEKPKEDPAEKTQSETQDVGGKPASESYTVKTDGTFAVSAAAGTGPTDVTQAKPENEQVSVELPVPSRPKHVDQYVHLLPEKTQEHAAQLKDLYRELDSTREKMNLLMDDKTAKDDDRAAWAKKATGIDNKIRKILDELDAEWVKLVKTGRVVVDDLGNARVMDDGRGKTEEGSAADDQPSEVNPELTSEQKARRRELRKWLVDTRRGNGDTREEHVKKWKDNFREFLALEGDAAFSDEKIKAAADHYGIVLVEVRGKKEDV